MERKRTFISVYFSDARSHGKKKRDVILAFYPGDELYEAIKNYGSTRIKEVIGITSYSHLLESAKKEDRTIGNLIKHKLRVHLENEQKNSLG
jgi:hypothetical protein